MARPWAAQVAWLALGVALLLPAQWSLDAHPAQLLALPVEWCVAVAVAAQWPHHRCTRPLLAASWWVLLTLELARMAGRLLTAADPQLYDLIFLAQHLWVLLVDLWGAPWVLLGLITAGAALVGITAAVAQALRPILSAPHTPRFALGTSGLAIALTVLPGDFGARSLLAGWPQNVWDSAQTWQRTRHTLSTDPYAPLMDVVPVHTPDIGLYVVESYGRVLATTPSLRAAWLPLLAELEPELAAEGWSMASGYATAPVSGGRSWISDATVFLGIAVHHQSTWAHLQPHTARFTHLPGWLAQHGYHTVVCRPKDRARLGLSIRNDFGWHTGLFADDLGYTGVLRGWGEVPDQYSLGVLHTQALPDLPRPTFTFFHGVSAHAPWDDVPVLADSWQAVAADTSAALPRENTDTHTTLMIQARRFGAKVDEGVRLPGRMFPQKRQEYFTAIHYSLRATLQALRDRPSSPHGQLVVVYGDHQPPFIARPGDFDVPVHVLATDPALLQPFFDHGFQAGLVPSEDAAPLPLQALFPTLASALSARPLPEVPWGLDLASMPIEAAP